MSQAMTNDDFNLDLFIKICNMMQAENDNQVLIAARKATAMLRANDLDWEKFARSKITIVNDPFGSIAEPPKAAAAPRPQAPPQPAPPSRLQRDTVIVARRFAILAANRALISSYHHTRLDQIVIDWQHHAPLMSDADYTWLGQESSLFVPQARTYSDVDRYLDTCDFAPLSDTENARVRAIRSIWERTRLMTDYDYNYLQGLHYRHRQPARQQPRRRRRP